MLPRARIVQPAHSRVMRMAIWFPHLHIHTLSSERAPVERETTRLLVNGVQAGNGLEISTLRITVGLTFIQIPTSIVQFQTRQVAHLSVDRQNPGLEI